jgi:hypothetical protein
LKVEALEAIYPEEFSLSLTGDVPVYTIKLVPDPSAEPEENHVSVALVCLIPASYPDADTLPVLTIEVLKGLSKRQADEIKEAADACAAENVGMASIFTVAECVREVRAPRNLVPQWASAGSSGLATCCCNPNAPPDTPLTPSTPSALTALMHPGYLNTPLSHKHSQLSGWRTTM